MTYSPSKQSKAKQTMEEAPEGTKILCVGDQDAAIILREDETMDLAIPEVTTEYVPEHILMAAALAHALSVPELCDQIREAFLEATYRRGAADPKNDNTH